MKKTYINSSTIINGSITVKTDIVIEGRITGDIVAENNVNVSGKIDGNMVSISGGYVIENINAKSNLTTDSSAVIIGDITADNFNSNGKVKGNLQIISANSENDDVFTYPNNLDDMLNYK